MNDSCSPCSSYPSLILPPVDLRAKFLKNTFASQSNLIARLTWEASPTPHITSYLIHRNGKLIGTVGSTGPLIFFDRNRQKHKTYKYQVTAIEESPPATIKIKARR
jgi:hypothetical protein